MYLDALLRAKGKEIIRNSSLPEVDSTLVADDSYWSGTTSTTSNTSKKLTIRIPPSAALSENDRSGDPEYLQGSTIHHRGPLDKFIHTLDDPQICGNLLDAGSQDLNRPWFVTYVGRE